MKTIEHEGQTYVLKTDMENAIQTLNPDLDQTAAVELLQKIRRERAEFL